MYYVSASTADQGAERPNHRVSKRIDMALDGNIVKLRSYNGSTPSYINGSPFYDISTDIANAKAEVSVTLAMPSYSGGYTFTPRKDGEAISSQARKIIVGNSASTTDTKYIKPTFDNEHYSVSYTNSELTVPVIIVEKNTVSTAADIQIGSKTDVKIAKASLSLVLQNKAVTSTSSTTVTADSGYLGLGSVAVSINVGSEFYASGGKYYIAATDNGSTLDSTKHQYKLAIDDDSSSTANVRVYNESDQLYSSTPALSLSEYWNTAHSKGVSDVVVTLPMPTYSSGYTFTPKKDGTSITSQSRKIVVGNSASTSDTKYIRPYFDSQHYNLSYSGTTLTVPIVIHEKNSDSTAPDTQIGSKIDVTISKSSFLPILKDKTITENCVIRPDDGFIGFDQIIVQVPTPTVTLSMPTYSSGYTFTPKQDGTSITSQSRKIVVGNSASTSDTKYIRPYFDSQHYNLSYSGTTLTVPIVIHEKNSDSTAPDTQIGSKIDVTISKSSFLPILKDKTITENCVIRPDDGFIGFDQIIVAVPQTEGWNNACNKLSFPTSSGADNTSSINITYPKSTSGTVFSGETVRYTMELGSGNDAGYVVLNHYNPNVVPVTFVQKVARIGLSAPTASGITSGERTDVSITANSKTTHFYLVKTTYADSSGVHDCVELRRGSSGTSATRVGRIYI